jgi:hypothetical protein
MRPRARPLIVICLLLSACGDKSRAEIGFVNHTQHSDAQLWNLWHAAQQSVASEIDLNPLEQQLNNSAAQILSGDGRALSTWPHQLVVSSEPDVPSATLFAATGEHRTDPTGLILCPRPCNLDYAPAYSLYALPATRYAQSWEFAGGNFDLLVEYEFENQILNALGYDTRWR